MDAPPARRTTGNAPRGGRTGGLLWAALLTPLAVGACAWQPWIPDEPTPAHATASDATIALHLGEPHADTLDCPAGRCQERFRIELPEAGVLRVRVRPRESSPEARVRVVLESGVGVVAQKGAEPDAPGDQPVEVTGEVRAGPHYVLVQAIGGRVAYDVEARFAPGVAPEPAASGAIPQVARPTATPETGHPGSGTGATHDPAALGDFARWLRYAFAATPEQRLEAGEAVALPATETQVLRAIRYELADRGYQQTDDPTEAEFLVSARVGAHTRTAYMVRGVTYREDYDVWFDRWGVTGPTLQPRTSSEGWLVVDFVDPRTGRLLWHGWTHAGIAADEDLRDQIRRAVRDVLSRFPPSP